MAGGEVSSQHSVGRAIAGVIVGGAGSRKKKPTHSAAHKRLVEEVAWVGSEGLGEGGGNFTPKEQQVERLRVRRAGGRRQESLA